mmetsp:Transcript_34023/g.85416  ORF Transcript_34023/g.85416 Transcript_34023/m.85416 type:complete len:234 (+) Transcript_34023:156-857(+)
MSLVQQDPYSSFLESSSSSCSSSLSSSLSSLSSLSSTSSSSMSGSSSGMRLGSRPRFFWSILVRRSANISGFSRSKPERRDAVSYSMLAMSRAMGSSSLSAMRFLSSSMMGCLRLISSTFLGLYMLAMDLSVRACAFTRRSMLAVQPKLVDTRAQGVLVRRSVTMAFSMVPSFLTIHSVRGLNSSSAFFISSSSVPPSFRPSLATFTMRHLLSYLSRFCRQYSSMGSIMYSTS